ncbi:MAG: pseudouridine-5'-phosphate glycosidase [Ancalomicrobiaceae bacterium]|nr:pseudouridine-5'-phosphate glycosidase [Ancalomicrobiaceae bacterium]
MSGETIVELSEEVVAAKAAGRGIVALESTIITHGLPWPQNLEVAEAVEAAVRQRGAVPATIAVIAGRVHVGLTHDQLVTLAKADDCLKLSRADLAYAVAKGRNGSTTVAATMIIARLAGISVFATGGIGGVHKGASDSFDISADLEELGRTDVTVVAAGAKAILDLPKTLEYLETKGVPVIGWATDEFPAFWSRASGLAAPLRLDTPAEFAAFVAARRRLGTTGGIFVANPIPPEFEIAREAIDSVIAAAVADAEAAGVKGKKVTPYLLSRMFDLTEGRSLVANRALILNNAVLAADLAKAIAGTV